MNKLQTLGQSTLAIGLICVMLVFAPACNKVSADQVLTDIKLLSQTATVVCSTLGTVLPADAAVCSAIANMASKGIDVIRTDYDAWRASPTTTNLQKVQAGIAQLRANLPAELAAAHISNQQSVATITAWVNLITSTLDAVLGMLPQLQAKGGRRASDKAVLKSLPTPQTIQQRWLTEVCKGDTVCGSKVHAK